MKKSTICKMAISAGLVALAGIAAITRGSVYAWLVLPAMALGFHGDMCLSRIPLMQKLHKNTFLGGAASFLLGHVVYAIAFISVMQPMARTAWWAIWGALAVYGVSSWLLYRSLRDKNPLLLLYMLGIAAMASCAFAAAVQRGGAWWMPAVGGLLFIVSDAIIGLKDFGGKNIPHADLLIWATYAPAQFFIVFTAFFS